MNTSAPPTAVSSNDAASLARRRRRRYWSLTGFALVALVGVGVVLYAWRLWPFTSAIQNTENATVRGQLTIISPQVSGYVTAVPVQDFQQVRAGQLLAKIDDRIYHQQLQQAQAQLQTAQANLANWEQSRRSATAVVAETAPASLVPPPSATAPRPRCSAPICWPSNSCCPRRTATPLSPPMPRLARRCSSRRRHWKRPSRTCAA